MAPERTVVSLASARRLAVARQHLSGPRPSRPSAEAVLATIRDLGYVQWDPVPIVAPSHLLSLWARFDGFAPAMLDRLLWEEKRLFLHWTPMASIVLTEDYPLYRSFMDRYPESLSHSWNNHRVRARAFLARNEKLRRRVLQQLSSGPRTIGQFEDHARTRKDHGEFEPGSEVSQMLFHLLMAGQVMVVGHKGAQNLWGLSKEFLPRATRLRGLSEDEAEGEAAQRAIRAMGVASPPEITYYFVRGRYEHLRETLARLERDSLIHPVVVEGASGRQARYVHALDLPKLAEYATDPPEPRLSLIPPFDNMVCGTARNERLFGFRYVREQFVPEPKRRYGTYVLPIVWGDRFIGRIDPRMDRKSGTLLLQSVHAEPEAPLTREVGLEIRGEVERLAEFLGARSISCSSKVPQGWKGALTFR